MHSHTHETLLDETPFAAVLPRPQNLQPSSNRELAWLSCMTYNMEPTAQEENKPVFHKAGTQGDTLTSLACQ